MGGRRALGPEKQRCGGGGAGGGAASCGLGYQRRASQEKAWIKLGVKGGLVVRMRGSGDGGAGLARLLLRAC